MSLFEVEFYVLDYIIDSCLVLIFSNIKIYFFILMLLMCKMCINFSDIFRMNKMFCIICWVNIIIYS